MNPDDFKAALLARLGLTPAPKPDSSRSALLAALLPKQPAAAFLLPGENPNEPTQGKFDRLTHSAFADTLQSIAGTPGKFNYADASVQPYHGASGVYEGTVPYYQKDQEQGKAGDIVSITPGGVIGFGTASPAGYDRAPGRDPEYTLAHEMGHRFEQKMRMQELGGYDHRVPGIASARVFDSTVTSPKATGYAATSPKEHFADAFANAVDFLRITSKTGRGQTEATLRPAAAEYERRVAGTTPMIQALLAQPIYKNHPINVARQMAVRPDATATQAPSPNSSQLLAAALGAALKKP